MSLRDHIESCIAELRQGALTEEKLRAVLDDAGMQDILYLQAANTSVASQVLGIALVENGEVRHLDTDPEKWPYQTVLDAVRDGWRIVSFPSAALLPLDDATYGLGCEFILERFATAG